jgi:hypothetical protein
MFGSCFVGKTVKRAKNLYKVVTNRTDSTGKPLIQTYYPKLLYAKSLYAVENDKWNAANDAKRNIVVVNNLTNLFGLTSRCVALVKFDLSSLPQTMLGNPESIQEAILMMSGIGGSDKAGSRISPMMIKTNYDIESISWKNKPKVDQFILTFGGEESSSQSMTNVRPLIIKMLKKKRDYGFMLQPAKDASKDDSLLEQVLPSERNGVMAEIPIANIRLMVY